MLTARQQEALAAINAIRAETGLSPTVRELSLRLGGISTSHVHALLCGLEKRGAIRRMFGLTRAIEVLDRPRPRAAGTPMVYLASPYSAQPCRARAEATAAEAAGRLMDAGLMVLSPIAHGCAVARQHPPVGDWPQDRWMAWCETALARSDALVVLTLAGWPSSRGVAHEIATAHGLDIPVLMLDPGFDATASDATASVERIRRVIAQAREDAA